VVSMVMRQPMIWATVLGLLGTFIPRTILSFLLPAIGGMGGTASPLAFFLLGLYLHERRAVLLQWEPLVLAVVGWKLVAFPLAMGTLATVLVRTGWLTSDDAAVLMLQAAMPTAISAFSLALEFDLEPTVAAKAIVVSTTVAFVTLPLWAMSLTLWP